MREHKRLAFVEERDGVSGAVAFAQSTLRQYRKAVLNSRKRGSDKPSHASLPQYRRGFIESYLVCKAYLAAH